MNEKSQHHPWCNFWSKDPDDCWMCKDFFERFPLKEGQTKERELTIEYFPEVKIIR